MQHDPHPSPTTGWNFSAWSIRNPVPPTLLFVVLIFLGLIGFMNLPVTRFPNIDIPLVSVSITQSGAAPAELETQVAKLVEDAVANLAGAKNVISTVSDGKSVTAIEFRLEVDIDRALNDVKDAITKIRADLPRTIDEPIIERIVVESQSIITYGVTAPDMTLEQLSWFVDDTVKRSLQGLKGVGRIDRIGGVDREIRVLVDPDRLMSLGLSTSDVNRQLRATAVDLAGGRSEVGGQEQSIRTLAGAHTVDDLADTKILLSGNRQARLSDLASISDGYSEPRSFARVDGETPVVAFSVFRTKGSSDVTVADGVRLKIADLAKAHPEVRFATIDDSVSFTLGNYDSAMSTLVEGSLLAIVVVLLFLRDWRATIITAIALPLSAIPTFWAISLMGFSLNLVSLLAITLATGILVDDAIVEIENIVRHQRMGKSPYRAAMEAADEIGLAVIAITFTIIAVFAPVSFMGGIAGQYFKQFGLVVAAAVFFSLMVARLITPMLAAYFMSPKVHVAPKDGFIMRAYVRLLEVTLARRYLTLICGIGLFALSIYAITLLPTGFIPPEDASRIVMSVELPPGQKLADTRRKTDEIAKLIKAKIPEARSVFVIGGASPTGSLDVRFASMLIRLTHKSQRQRTQKEIESDLATLLLSVPDARAWYVNPRGEREATITLVSGDPAALGKAVASVEAAMRRLPKFNNVAAAAGVERPEIRILPRLDEAARYGVATDAISEAVRVAAIGDINANLAKFTLRDRTVPIRVQLPPSARGDLGLLESLPVVSSSGGQVPLSAVASLSFGQGPATINRLNRERRVTIGADLRPGLALGQGLSDIAELPEVKNLPAGVRVAKTGDVEVMAEVFQNFAIAMGTGLLIVFALLVLLFASIFHPVTILLSLPLSIGGVILGLTITDRPISMPVVIGILMLMGIVTKNAIMLVDFAVERVKGGMSRQLAMIDAGRKRARPIIMTTIAMVAGMMPAALGHGDGGEFRSPMAIGVIGGLIVSTLLSLVFVPSFYIVMEGVGERAGRFFRRFITKSDEAQAHAAVVPLPGRDQTEKQGFRPAAE